jgi:phenylalanyl-tRNA synthetase alpha chain
MVRIRRWAPFSEKDLLLSQGERDVLRALASIGSGDIEQASRVSGIPKSTIASIIESLASKGLVRVERRTRYLYRATGEGLESLRGFPEEILLSILSARGGEAPLSEVEILMGSERASIAIAWARRRGWIEIRGDRVIMTGSGSLEKYREFIARASDGVYQDEAGLSSEEIQELVRRKMIVREEKRDILFEVTEKGYEVLKGLGDVHVVSRISRDIVSGIAGNMIIRPYNVEAEPREIYPAYKHFYVDFLEMLRDIMLSLGFDEIDDSLVVPELWNFDILYQAQDHPAREIHDTLVADSPPADLTHYRDLLERVSREHSSGWGYSFDTGTSSRLIMRSQTTAATIRYLYTHREPPVRAFIIGRVFRSDAIDAKHLPEFHQMDGVAMEHGMSLRRLLGILSQITRALGFREVLFKPGYFPFTEPSVEGYVWIEGLGYVEIFGAGLFRPEVLRMTGLEHNVGAWGMGVDRLAMAYLAISDIRELYSPLIDRLRWHRVASYKAIP